MAGPGDISGAPQEAEEDSGAKQSLNDLTQCHGQRVGPGSADFSPALVLPFLDSLVEGRGHRSAPHPLEGFRVALRKGIKMVRGQG